jgi:hypothetical protein
VAVLAALSAEPGGATVAVIAARIGHEKNGTATRIKGRWPGIADTWTPPRRWVGVPTTCGTRRSRCG